MPLSRLMSMLAELEVVQRQCRQIQPGGPSLGALEQQLDASSDSSIPSRTINSRVFVDHEGQFGSPRHGVQVVEHDRHRPDVSDQAVHLLIDGPPEPVHRRR